MRVESFEQHRSRSSLVQAETRTWRFSSQRTLFAYPTFSTAKRSKGRSALDDDDDGRIEVARFRFPSFYLLSSDCSDCFECSALVGGTRLQGKAPPWPPARALPASVSPPRLLLLLLSSSFFFFLLLSSLLKEGRCDGWTDETR